MSGLVIAPKTFNFDPSVGFFRNDRVQRAGTLAILDFSRADCVNGGVPRNLAADTAQALCGNPLHPVLAGRTANARFANNSLGLGAEKASLRFPTALTDYCVGRSIGISVFVRYIDALASELVPWQAGLAVALGALVTSGLNVYTVTAGGVLGADAPTHAGSGSSAANGSATLAWGVRNTQAGAYGSIGAVGGFLNLTDAYPSPFKFFGSGNTTFTTPFNTPLNQWAINHLMTSPAGSVTNGVTNGATKQLTAAEVPVIPTPDKFLQLSAELFNLAGLYNVSGGQVAANSAGQRLNFFRIVIDDLAVSARTHAQLYADDHAFVSTYHPARALLA